MSTPLEFRVSNPPSGLTLRFCDTAQDILLRVAQRWSFTYLREARIIRMRPAGGEGFLINQRISDDRGLPYRISVSPDATPDTMPQFGVVCFYPRSDHDFRQGYDMVLPLQLNPPRARKQHVPKEAPPPGHYQVLVCRPGEADALFNVPASEIHEQVKGWWRSGYAVQQDDSA